MKDLIGFSRKWYCKSCQSEVGSDEFCHGCMTSLWVVEITSEIQENIIHNPISFERSSISMNRNSGTYWPIEFKKSQKSRNKKSIKPKKSQKYICEICNKQFDSNKALEQHKEAKHSYICLYCNKILESEFDRELHIKDVHPEREELYPERKEIHKLYFVCKKCGNKYTSQEELKKHVKKC